MKKEKSMSIVCQCRKCEHLLYLTIDDKIFNDIKKIEKIDCPNCGEQGYENWILRGIDDFNNRKMY